MTILNIYKISTTGSCQESRYPDKENARLHQQVLCHCFHACKYKGIPNQEEFILFTTKDVNIYF